MFSKIIVLAVALSAVSAAVAPDYAQESDFSVRSFIHRCSYSSADINNCFVRNGNLAINELANGFEELGFVSLQGFDIGDDIYNLENDLSFSLENIKSYSENPNIENARLRFNEEGVFESVVMEYSLADYYWEGQYHANGYIGNSKVNERGQVRINFGSFYGNYSAQFKQKEIDGEIYLKVRQHSGFGNFERFEFIPSEVSSMGEPLNAEQFSELQQPVFNKAIATWLEYITYVFNQILLEIPQNELFLP